MAVRITTYSSLVKILPESAPQKSVQSGVMLCNETFSFQADLYLEPTNTLFNTFRLSVDGALKDYVSVFETEYVPVVKGHYPETDEYILSKQSGLYPDVLTPYPLNKAFVLHAERHKSFWIKVKGELPCGTHTVEVVLSNYENQELQRAIFQLEVIDYHLPQCTIPIHSWLHCDCICEQHGVQPYSKKFYSIFGEYLKSMREHGVNTLYVPLFTPALDTEKGTYRKNVQLVDVIKNGEKYQFQWDKLAYFIDYAKGFGFERFELCHLFTQWGAKHAPKIMAKVNGRNKRIFGWDTVADGEEYATFLKAFLPPLVQLLKKKEVRACFHLSDEPGDAFEQYAKIRALVKPYVQDYPIVDACPPEYQQKGLVDCAFVSTDIAEKHLDYIENCAVYYCCGQYQKYLSNRFITMPSLRNRVLGLQLYANGVKGFLHWGYNFYHSSGSRFIINPFLVNDGKGAYPAGDCFIVYPDILGGGVFESLRNEVFNEAIQDYRLMTALEDKKGKEYVRTLWKAFGVNGFCEYPRDEQAYLQFINECKKELKEQ